MSNNFTLEELCRSSFAINNNLENKPNPRQLQNMKVSVLALEYIRAFMGNYPVIVTSGFRSLAVNSGVGGSSTSSHIDGQAFDIIIKNGKSNQENARSIIKSDINFDQIIVYDSFIHIGFGSKKRRQLISKI